MAVQLNELFNILLSKANKKRKQNKKDQINKMNEIVFAGTAVASVCGVRYLIVYADLISLPVYTSQCFSVHFSVNWPTVLFGSFPLRHL